MDKTYWENFYAHSELTSEPSLFAKMCIEEYLSPGMVLFEAGCGNGRDAVAMAKAGVIVTAMDQCEATISALKETHAKRCNLSFISADFAQHTFKAPIDCFYSRFSLHAIRECEQEDLLAEVMKSLSPGGLILLEFRGQKNELNGVGTPDVRDKFTFMHQGHRRRFIDCENLSRRLVMEGLQVLLCEEKPGFSPFQGKDETFARIIARSPKT